MKAVIYARYSSDSQREESTPEISTIITSVPEQSG